MRWLLLGLMLVAACGDDYLRREVRVLYAPESATALLTLTGPIVTSRFPDSEAASTRTDASVFVIDLTDTALSYRQFIPIVATYDEPSLTVTGPIASVPCRAGEYAFVILDNVRDAEDSRIGRSGEFDRAFEGDGPFGELRASLVQVGVELASVAGATHFAVSCP
ncbi:MAG: hypothetical protein ACAI38_14115 [Myxococcota bacterium]|nr:hypothetical protein [Myxococcota bacterium]